MAHAQHFPPTTTRRSLRSPFAAGLRGGAPDTIRAAAILVDFDDQPMDSTRAYFERVLFHQNQYWEQVSYGQVVIDATVSQEVHRMPEPIAFYGDDELFGERQTLFVRDAVQVADDEFDYSQFDATFCIHAGGGQEADIDGDNPDGLWSVFVPLEAFEYFLPDSTGIGGVPTNDLDENGDPVRIQMALVLPEFESQDEDAAGNPFSFGMLGVYAHEFGHVLGLPDLYDTTPADFPDSQGIGSWGVMGAGTWNFNGFVPAAPCVWSAFELGYIDPLVITDDATVTLTARSVTTPGDRAALIPIGGDEYFLIENRLQDANANAMFDFFDADGDSIFTLYDLETPAEEADSYRDAEFDYFLPGEGQGSGLLIWHIDPSTIAANAAFNTVQGDPQRKGVDLEEADQIEDLDGLPVSLESFGSADDSYRAGHVTTFGPETIPNSNTALGLPSFVTIDQISAPGESMTFRVSFNAQGDLPRRKAGFQSAAMAGPLNGNHPASADLTGDGTLETALVDSLGSVYVIGPGGGSAFGDGALLPIGNVGVDARTSPAIVDVDQSGSLDVVVLGNDGQLFAFDGATGAPLGGGGPFYQRLDLDSHGSIPVAADRGARGFSTYFAGRSTVLDDNVEFIEVGQSVDGNRLSQVVRGLTGESLVPLVFTGADPAAPGGAWAVAALVDADGETEFVELWPDYGLSVPLERDRSGMQSAVRSLAAADLDGDGVTEIIASDDAGRIEVYHYARQAAGSIADVQANVPRLEGAMGWPFELGLAVTHDVALADVDRDGNLEILVSAFDGRVYALNFNGTPQAGFPLVLDAVDRPAPHAVPAPLAIDVAGDTAPELIVAAGDGRLLAIDGRGVLVPGFEAPGPAGAGPMPVVADVDQDGMIDALVPSDVQGQAMVVAFELPGSPGAAAWSGFRGGPMRGARPVASSPEPLPPGGDLLSDVYVYPNPATGDVANVHFSLARDARVRVSIVDAVGRVVAEPPVADPARGATQHVIAWPLAGQASGLYVLTVDASGSGQSDVQRFTFAVTR